MGKRKLVALLLASAMMLGNLNTIHAEESAGITFQDDAQEYFTFTKDKTDFTDAFIGMIPGETRSENFTLKNSSSDELRFYINGSVISDLQVDGENGVGAVYTITLAKDGEEFYRGLIGGADGTLKDLNSGDIHENQLLADLKKNEQCSIKMSIGIDGESMNNEYQNSQGQLQLAFHVENVEKAKTVMNVSTSDTTKMMGVLLALLVSGAIIIVVIKRRKEGEIHEN